MSVRWRLVLLSAAAVAVAIAIASAIVYVVVSSQLHDRIDDELRRDAEVTFELPILRGGTITPVEIGGSRTSGGTGGERGGERSDADAGGGAERLALPIGPLGGPAAYAQLVKADGDVVAPARQGERLPATPEARAIAAGDAEAAFTDVELSSGKVRVYTVPVGSGQAIQIARSLDETEETLDHLAVVLVAVSLGGIALGAALGLLVSRAALSPVARLSRLASEVASTRDPSRRIEPAGGHELAELARSFNRMLTELEASLDAQRQLVADASHELRTPLASLRTNIEVLAHSERLDPGSRERLLADVVAQLDEFTGLVGDLVDLARDPQFDEAPQLLRLDHLAEAAMDAAQVRHPGARIELMAERCFVSGVEQDLQRAISNLLDNAIKWGPPGEPIEVMVTVTGEVRVRDRGPGIPDEDLPHVFDRFYRSTASRGTPGSGLGLAIVRRVAEGHGGTAVAAAAPGGGTEVTLRIPVAAEPAGARGQAVLT
jgi:two-component system, OmpR family, sensor histidine kinase MprB